METTHIHTYTYIYKYKNKMKINPTEIFAIAQKSCITVKRMHQKIITKTRERKTTVKRKTTTQLQTSTSTLNH